MGGEYALDECWRIMCMCCVDVVLGTLLDL